MERKEDAQLIYDILSGNDDAFNALVQKYQKSVHALAWRKIGDFHYAEEITQDTFLQAYQKPSKILINLLGGCMSSQIGFALIGFKGTNRRCSRWRVRQ